MVCITRLDPALLTMPRPRAVPASPAGHKSRGFRHSGTEGALVSTILVDLYMLLGRRSALRLDKLRQDAAVAQDCDRNHSDTHNTSWRRLTPDTPLLACTRL